MLRPILYIICVIGFLIGCQEKDAPAHPGDRLLASVYGSHLYYSDIEPIIQKETSKEDSIQYSNAIIEKWVRDAILMYEAEKNISKDLDIEKMVDDYRSSLILLNYKQKLVHEQLDTSVSEGELEEYYKEHQAQYKLEEPLIQCVFLKVSKENEKLDEIEDLWDDKKYKEIVAINNAEFEIILMPEFTWYPWKDIKALFPKSMWTYSNIKEKKSMSKSSGKYKYFLNVKNYRDENKISPLSYIEDQIKKVILHKRQTELLDNLEEELYQKYSKSNQIKINI